MEKMKPQDIDNALCEKLENDHSYTLESLSAELGIDKADVHRSFIRLCRQPGWSIRPSNRTAYWRDYYSERNFAHYRTYTRQDPISNRGRKKGEKYEHCPAESDWNRTYFKVRRPEHLECPE